MSAQTSPILPPRFSPEWRKRLGRDRARRHDAGRRPSPSSLGRHGGGSPAAEKPAFQADGQVGDLAFHGRRPQPHRSLRSEACSGTSRRPAVAGFLRQADHRDGYRQQLPHAVQADLEAARPERHLGLRLVRPHCRACRRPDRVSRLLRRRFEPRRVGVPDEHRIDSCGTAGSRRMGDLWTRIGESEPAKLCRPHRLGRSGGRSEELEWWILTRHIPRNPVPERRRSHTGSDPARQHRR